MEQGNSLRQSAMYYGAIIGALLVFFMLFSYVFNLTASTFMGYLQYFIMAVGIYISQKKYRDEEMGGLMSYGKALGFGTLTIFFSALIVGFFTYVLYAVIDPGLLTQIINAAEKALYESGLSQKEIDDAMAVTIKITNPLILSLAAVLGTTFFGFLFSLATSFLTKKDNDTSGNLLNNG